MVQVIQPRDIGGEIGQAFGGGLSNIAQLKTRQEMAGRGLDALSALGEDATALDYAKALAKGAAVSPAIAEMAGPLYQAMIAEKKLKATEDLLSTKDDGRARKPTDRADAGEPSPVDGRPGMRDVPEAGELPIGGLLTNEEKEAIIKRNFNDPGKITAEIQAAENNKIQQQQNLLETQTRRREMEREEATEVMGRTHNLLREKGLISGDEPLPDRYNRIAYNYFDSERNRDPKATISELWNRAGKRLDRKIDDVAKQSRDLAAPRFRGNKNQRIEAASRWSQQHLKAYGNTKEDRDLLKGVFTENGWTPEEASRIVQPLSGSQKSVINRLPKVRNQGIIEKAMEQVIDPRPLNEVQLRRTSDRFVDGMLKEFTPSTSLVNMKSRLVREKGFTDDEALSMITDLQDSLIQQGRQFTEEQINEIPFLGERVRPSLIDIFGGRSVYELGEPLAR
jgi:hypothetical protein